MGQAHDDHKRVRERERRQEGGRGRENLDLDLDLEGRLSDLSWGERGERDTKSGAHTFR